MTFSGSPHKFGYAVAQTIVAFGADGDVCFASLCTDVAKVAATLRQHFVVGTVSRALDARAEEPPRIAIACQDRYRFLVGLLGAWAAELDVVLPHNTQIETIRQLKTSSAIRSIMHDFDFVHGVDLRVVLEKAPTPSAGYDLRTLDVHSERVALRVFTSGSSGLPTQHAKSFRQLFCEVETLAQTFALHAEDRFLSTVPPHHLYGLLFGTLLPLWVGASFVRTLPAFGASIAHALGLHNITTLITVPVHLHALVESMGTPSGEEVSLRRVFSSGQALPKALFARAHNAPFSADESHRVLEVLGSTETGGIGWRSSAEDVFELFPGLSMTVNENDEMQLRSPFLPTDAVFASQDCVEPLPHRRFRHLGRRDGVLKVASTRVSLQEIETLACEMPTVHAAFATAQQSTGARGQECWLAVEGDATREQVLAHLRGRLEAVVVPRRVRIFAELPRTAAGKPDRVRIELAFAAPNKSST